MSLTAALAVAARLRDSLGKTAYVWGAGGRYGASLHRPRDCDLRAILPAHGYRSPHRDYR